MEISSSNRQSLFAVILISALVIYIYCTFDVDLKLHFDQIVSKYKIL